MKNIKREFWIAMLFLLKPIQVIALNKRCPKWMNKLALRITIRSLRNLAQTFGGRMDA
ncbi:hypothetical protein KYLE_98 [Pantoea phage Kyle]|uniref:Uncharacterized protein n=1 Tax=Pantoea phage Kyle TaxID=2589665 RepID=A0A514A8N3_9CAUD|nr:hypothetical protein HWC52_gp098 [Pantoea phage Kyle]QDH49626.1 hypothetical protein KYLE_98 [Pantoea phage Kyle]